MHTFVRNRVLPIIALIGVACCLHGCAVIAGSDDGEQSAPPLVNIEFVETLANQKSLQGESYREMPAGTPRAGSLRQPSAVYADKFRVYVTDTALPAKVLIFDRTERTVSTLNVQFSSGVVEGRLLAPSGIAVDASSVIFVSDPQQGKVFGFDRNGKLLTELGRPHVVNVQNGLGDLASPVALALNPANNRLYIADLHGQQVAVFNTMGSHLFDIGRSGRRGEDFKFPAAVALDRAGNVYVLDSLRRRVYIFSSDGAFQSSFSLKKGLPTGTAIKPSGIAVDSDGHVYVTDAVNNTVIIFDNAGSYLVSWGKIGKLFGDFWTPSGIYIDNDDYIYISDQMNSRVQVFRYAK